MLTTLWLVESFSCTRLCVNVESSWHDVAAVCRATGLVVVACRAFHACTRFNDYMA